MKKIKVKHFRPQQGITNGQLRKDIRIIETSGDVDALMFHKPVFTLKEEKLTPRATGGVTTVEYEVPSVGTVMGIARCSPKQHFCRRTGRTIAEGRLRKELEAMGIKDI